MPSDRVRAEHVSEEGGDVAQPVGLVAVDRVVVFGKGGLEQVRPETVDLGKSLSDQTVELRVCPFLRATLDDHRRQLRLQAGRQGDFHQLVAAFFEVDTGHDG